MKNVYTGLTLIHNDKKRLSQIVFINILDGCFGSKEIVLFLRDSIIKEFSLLGDAGDEILDSLYFALSIYIKKQAAAQSI
ncbi:MAG: hypothetical protein M0D57_00750 [Sphingobacteriales bacterium JAD_PAG50586_3]|nr:MAG: hypothetical protein M0D57_00750 [Sphingobacteriales bacterium JAD_PAG50586_3]